ncbi:isocitrate lyase/phosphoenolpyruvate mutase family protein [Sphingomonas sp.]|jgi:2-methylisocitrate lyase-like PEP mutase family enzyme|uniref:isocitrate lyase/PEP mutase family protein n=1 Tax=Sphingomonas sp. TaxID=28214 RepID=UPI0035C85E59
MNQAEAYRRFRTLHEERRPFIMPNAWDAASAIVLKQAGFEALGTSSAAIAWALGRQDGVRAVTRAEAIANGALIGTASGLPVNGDLEDGFGATPEDCVATVEAAIAGGLAGLGIEDTTADAADPIHGLDHAVTRVRAAAKAAQDRILLTGRTDLLLHGRGGVDEAIARLVAFAEAGADVLYAPGLRDIDSVCAVVAAVAPRPVNVLASPALPLDALAEAGVARISLGATLYTAALGGLKDAADALARGDMATGAKGMPMGGVLGALPR